MENVWTAFGLTLFAGLSTGIGSLIALFAPRTNHRFLALATGCSAGVMLYISCVEMFPEANQVLIEYYGETMGQWLNVAGFFGGILLIGAIDLLIPSSENPHERPSESGRLALRDDAYRGQGRQRGAAIVKQVAPPACSRRHSLAIFRRHFVAALHAQTAIAVAIALLTSPGHQRRGADCLYQQSRCACYSFASGWPSQSAQRLINHHAFSE